MDIGTRIREFMKEETLHGDTAVADDSPFLNGAMESMGAMRLVASLEDEFDVEIDDAEIIEDDFQTVRHIAQLVDQTRGSA